MSTKEDLVCALEEGIECAHEEGFFDEFNRFDIVDTKHGAIILQVDGARFKLTITEES